MAKLVLPPYDLFPENIANLDKLNKEKQMYVLWSYRENDVRDILQHFGVTKPVFYRAIGRVRRNFLREYGLPKDKQGRL